MSTFLVADTHFSHTRAIELCGRPFLSVGEMDEALIRNWNSVVGPDDTVYHLGDCCMGQLADSLPILNRLNGRKLLVLGNHDRPSQAYHHKTPEARAKWFARYQEYFPVMFEELRLDLGPNGETVIFNHMPYADPTFVDHAYEGRHAQFQPINEGRWLIHGHVHGAWKTKGKQINVGVDVWGYAPVDLDVVINMMKENPDGFPS